MPNDLGAHQRWNSSGFVHASHTSRAGPSNVRVITNSRSDFRSAVVWLFVDRPWFSLVASIVTPSIGAIIFIAGLVSAIALITMFGISRTGTFLGREQTDRFGFLDTEAMEHGARQTIERMRLRIPQ